LIHELARNTRDIQIVLTGLRPGDKVEENELRLRRRSPATIERRAICAVGPQCDATFLRSLQRISESIRERNIAALDRPPSAN